MHEQKVTSLQIYIRILATSTVLYNEHPIVFISAFVF